MKINCEYCINKFLNNWLLLLLLSQNSKMKFSLNEWKFLIEIAHWVYDQWLCMIMCMYVCVFVCVFVVTLYWNREKQLEEGNERIIKHR